MTDYALIEGGSVLRAADGATIPLEPGNRDYAAYLLWVAAGNTAASPPVLQPIIPASVTNFQARSVMRATILGDGRSMDTTIRDTLAANRASTAGLPESSPTRIQADIAWLAWEQSNDFYRNSALIISMGGALGLTSTEIDALFVAADAVEA